LQAVMNTHFLHRKSLHSGLLILSYQNLEQARQEQQRTVLLAIHRYQRKPSSAANAVGRNN
jgi:hypothetical protein